MTRMCIAGLAAGLSAFALAASGLAQTPSGPAQSALAARGVIVSDGHTRIADPKLEGGGVAASFHLEGAGSVTASAVVLGAGGPVDLVWSGTLVGGAAPTSIAWDGRDASGDVVPTGAYVLRVAAQGALPLALPIDVVRLGITEIEFQDSPAGNDEWQMVYFKKGSTDGVFYATPATGEYRNLKGPGEASDLDLDDGSPRPPVAVHAATDQPVMQGSDYATERFNYPVAYLVGASPRLEVTLGTAGTAADGRAMGANYPVPGFDLRLKATFASGATATSAPIAPGAAVVVDAPPLPLQAGRHPLPLTWSFEYAPKGGGWAPIPGSTTTGHRVFTQIGAPKFKAGASGTQYTGPWVEVASDFATWRNALALDTSTADGVVHVFVKGYFGQNAGLPAAIEGVIYDAYPLGGDGGATHYFDDFGKNMDLSALLNAHAKGVYVNCTDNMGATTTMLSMLGVANVRPLRLGPMTLNAIWGIGAPSYTTALWGGSHGFSYHHIVTRTDGVNVIDTCMQLDEDGAPASTPGLPGWNVDRPWDGPLGYEALSAKNDVTKQLESLPGLF